MHRIPKGVLNSEQIGSLEQEGVLSRVGGKIAAEGSALDLHLGSVCWKLEGSIKQIARVDASGQPTRERVEEVCNTNGKRLELTDEGVEVGRGTVFVVQLEESLNFSQYPWLCGEATGKSSIGRLDVLTRLLADGCSEYERVPERYKGSLYVEIVPISFPVRIYPGVSLNQLRIHCGPMSPLRSLVGRRLLYRSDDGAQFSAAAQEAGTLSLDLLPRQKNGLDISAYVLRESPPSAALDLRSKGAALAADYFEPINAKNGKLKIEVDRFYILRSVERLMLPEDIAVTGMAYSENLGELRIHYAGFAHPWFGMDREDKKTGTPLIFEVRAHSFPILLRHEEVFASIRFYEMACAIPSSERKSEKNGYSEQELKLSNYFRDS